MKIKQMKVGHALKGMSSNILEEKEFDMEFKDHMVHVRRKVASNRDDYFIIFMPNIAYIIPHQEKAEK